MLTLSIMLGIACVIMTLQQMKVISLLRENQIIDNQNKAFARVISDWEKQDSEKGQFINL